MALVWYLGSFKGFTRPGQFMLSIYMFNSAIFFFYFVCNICLMALLKVFTGFLFVWRPIEHGFEFANRV